MEKDTDRDFQALNLGGQIRQLRNQKRLTLQDVSDRSGLSKPLLSQIENSVTAPPIATLLKISRALGVHISHFFQEKTVEDRISVVRRSNRLQFRRHSDRSIDSIGYRYEALTHPIADKHMEPFIVDIESRTEDDLVYFQHHGEEFLFVVGGTVEFRGKDKVVTLDVGDSLYFDSNISHALRGIGGSARVLAIIYSPEPIGVSG